MSADQAENMFSTKSNNESYKYLRIDEYVEDIDVVTKARIIKQYFL